MPSRLSRRTRSTLLSARIARRPLVFSCSMIRRVSGSSGRAASTSSTMRSASAAPAQAAATIARSRRRRGAKMPGVSTSTSCAARRCAMPEQPGARRLHLRRDDRQLAADQPVEQRRFAGIRRADQRDIAAAAWVNRSAERPPARGPGSGRGGSRHLTWPLGDRLIVVKTLQQRGGCRGFGGALRDGGGARLVHPATRTATVKLRRVIGAARRPPAHKPAAAGRVPAPIPAAPSWGRAAAASIRSISGSHSRSTKAAAAGKPAIEIDRGDHRLQHVGEDAGVARGAGSGLGRRQPDMAVEADIDGPRRQRLAPHQMA